MYGGAAICREGERGRDGPPAVRVFVYGATMRGMSLRLRGDVALLVDVSASPTGMDVTTTGGESHTFGQVSVNGPASFGGRVVAGCFAASGNVTVGSPLR